MDDDLRLAQPGITGAAAALHEGLALADLSGLESAELVDLMAGLERLKGAAAACQARAVVVLAAQEREAGRADGVAVQVGLATRQSPARARRFVGFAHALAELPHTFDTLAAGETTEYRAFLVRGRPCSSPARTGPRSTRSCTNAPAGSAP